MKNEIFVDTSGWLCFFDNAQPQYGFCRVLVNQHTKQGGRLVTTSGVLDELIPLLSSRTRSSRQQILASIVFLQSLENVEIVHITPELHRRAFELLLARPDKEWSWVDAASFIVMQERAIPQALTTDHHFDQAGFVRLLA